MGIGGLAVGLLVLAVVGRVVLEYSRRCALARRREAAEEELMLLGVDAQPSISLKVRAARRRAS